MKNSEVLRVERHARIRLLTLSRPAAANALNGELCGELVRNIDAAERDAEVRAVVLTGTGDVFCAGADLKERLANPGQDFELRRPILALWHCLHRFAKPLVLGVNGHALGGGMELLFHADCVIASSAAQFALPEVQWAGIPGGWATQVLPRLVGPLGARWLILSGTKFDAESALRMGLITEAVPAADVMRRALEAAELLASRPAGAVAAAKEAVRLSLEVPLSAGVEIEDRLLQLATSSAERQSLLASFARGARPDGGER